MPVDTAALTQDSAWMDKEAFMDRSDKLQLRKAERMIADGEALASEGYRLKRALDMRLFMRAKRAKDKS